MDFGFQLDGGPVVIPRNHQWELQLGGSYETEYGFVGTGRKINNDYILADGVNEKGLAIAELYYLNEADYITEADKNKLNLAPHEFIMWVLGNIASISELEEKIKGVNVVNAAISLLGIAPPLHFIVTDKTCRTVVIETENQKLTFKEDPVGVMTNSPSLEWHLKNLSNYLSVQPNNFPERKIGGFKIKPFGQGTGTSGLPGGLTSAERFVRAVYLRIATDKGETYKDGLNAIFRILDNVTIPKGINIKEDGASDFTQYRAVMDVDNLTYYFSPYSTQDVFSLDLVDALVNLEKPKKFEVNSDFKVTRLN
jgi:choloylglycine hydrolase